MNTINTNNFYILGETDEEGNTLYWSNDKGWVEKSNATTFGEEILTLPPMEGATGIIEENEDCLPVNFYGVPPYPEGSVRW
jgi:hypothetical protein